MGKYYNIENNPRYPQINQDPKKGYSKQTYLLDKYIYKTSYFFNKNKIYPENNNIFKLNKKLAS